MKGGHNAVPEDRVGDRFDIVGRHMKASVEQCSGLAPQNEVLTCARAGAPADVLFDEAESLLFVGSGGSDEVPGVDEDVIGDWNLADDLL